MDFSEPEHIHQLRDSLKRFVEREAPTEKVTQWDRDDYVPTELLLKLAAMGVCGLTVDEEHGSYGRDIYAMVTVIEELAKASTPLASLYIMNTVYGCMNIHASASAAQKQRWLPDLLAGKTLFALGLSEPDVGADLASVATTAERYGDKVIINGSKRWCTGANIADYLYLLVRSGPVEQRYKNLSFVVVPRNTAGISITAIDTIGCHGIQTNNVYLDHVELPFDCLVGGEAGWNQGWKMLAGPALEAEKLQLPALALGIAEAAQEEAWKYSQERKQFGQAICTHQAVRHDLIENRTKLHACRLMLQHAAWSVQEERASATDTSMTKLFVAESCVEVVLTCQRILGAYGYAKGFQMERYVRDILVMPIFGGSSAIQKNNIANLLRLPRG